MWKIRIEYKDKSRMTITGKHKDIPLGLATAYFNEYVAGREVKATYQQYPKKDYEAMDLYKKIEQLESREE